MHVDLGNANACPITSQQHMYKNVRVPQQTCIRCNTHTSIFSSFSISSRAVSSSLFILSVGRPRRSNTSSLTARSYASLAGLGSSLPPGYGNNTLPQSSFERTLVQIPFPQQWLVQLVKMLIHLHATPLAFYQASSTLVTIICDCLCINHPFATNIVFTVREQIRQYMLHA